MKQPICIFFWFIVILVTLRENSLVGKLMFQISAFYLSKLVGVDEWWWPCDMHVWMHIHKCLALYDNVMLFWSIVYDMITYMTSFQIIASLFSRNLPLPYMWIAFVAISKFLYFPRSAFLYTIHPFPSSWE